MTTESDENWTLEITPRSRWFYVPFKDIWRYRDLLWLFVRRDFVSFYKQTILGPMWFFIQPLFTTLIFVLIFGQIGKLAHPDVPQVLFYLCSVTFWNYFAECLNKTAMTFKDNATLFGKVYFPRLIVPLSIVLSSLLKFGVQFTLFLGAFAWYVVRGEVSFTWSPFFVFPLVISIMGILGLGLGMLFSAMTTKYRDLVFLLQFAVQLLMYGSGVIFTWSAMLRSYPSASSILQWNPLIHLIETIRSSFFSIENPFGMVGLVYPAFVAIAVFVLACMVFNRVEKTFMDTV